MKWLPVTVSARAWQSASYRKIGDCGQSMRKLKCKYWLINKMNEWTINPTEYYITVLYFYAILFDFYVHLSVFKIFLFIFRLTTHQVSPLIRLLTRKSKMDWCMMLLIFLILGPVIDAKYSKKTKKECGTGSCKSKDQKKTSMWKWNTSLLLKLLCSHFWWLAQMLISSDHLTLLSNPLISFLFFSLLFYSCVTSKSTRSDYKW